MRKTIHTEQSMAIREAIRAVREKAGLSQRELGRRLGREHSFVSKLELGERRVDIVEFYWICKACNASPDREAQALMKVLASLEVK